MTFEEFLGDNPSWRWSQLNERTGNWHFCDVGNWHQDDDTVKNLLKKFVTSGYYKHLVGFDKYGKLVVAFYYFLLKEQIGIYNNVGKKPREFGTERAFLDSYYKGWVQNYEQRKILKIVSTVGVSWSKDTQNTLEDLADYCEGNYCSKEEKTTDVYLFNDIAKWKDVCKKLKKSKEFDEMDNEVQEQVMDKQAMEEQVEEQAVEEQVEEQAVEEQVEQVMDEQAQEESRVEAEPMEEREEFSEETPVVEDKQAVDKKQKHAEANRRYKEKQAQEQAELTAACVQGIELLKRIGMWEELSERSRTALLKYAYKPTGNSIVRKVFGDVINIGDTVTVEQVFRITQLGIKEFQKKLDEWFEKEGVKVEYKENPDNIFNSTYTIVQC